MEDERTGATGQDLTINIAQLFKLNGVNDVVPSNLVRRLGQTETRDDRDIITDLTRVSGPSKLYWCEDSGVLSGFQMWYGSYQPIVGKQHGDLKTSDTCKETILPVSTPVWEIHVFKQSSARRVVGMALKFKSYTDTEVDGSLIQSMGYTDDSDASVTRYVIRLPTGQLATERDFWGFYSTQTWDHPDHSLSWSDSEETPGSRIITDISVITYHKE